MLLAAFRAVTFVTTTLALVYSGSAQAQAPAPVACTTAKTAQPAAVIAECSKLIQSGRTSGPALGQIYRIRGYNYTRAENHVAAKQDFDQAIRLNGNDANTYGLRAVSHYMLKQYDLAIADYSAVIHRVPTHHGAYNQRGMVYLQKGMNKRALEDFEAALKIQPDNGEYTTNKAKALMTMMLESQEQLKKHGITPSRIEPKAQTATTAQTPAPTQSPAPAPAKAPPSTPSQVVAACDETSMPLAAVIEACTKLIQSGKASGPALAELYRLRGFAHLRGKNFGTANQDYTQAVKLNGNDDKAYAQRAVTYYVLKQYDQAIADYSVLIGRRPGLHAAYNERGRAYLEKGMNQVALQDFETALKIDPNNASYMANKAKAQQQAIAPGRVEQKK